MKKLLLALAIILIGTCAGATVANTDFQSTGTGDGADTTFDFTWPIVEDDSVKVYVNKVLKTLGSDYTLTTNRLTTGLGGTVTFTSAPAASAAIIIQRESDQKQESNLVNNQAMPPATVMAMIDKLTHLVQDALRKYTSSDTTIAASTLYTFAHGLGKVPDRVQLLLECQTTEGGYAVDDLIDVAQCTTASGGAFCTVQRDMVNIYVRTGPSGVSPLNVINKTVGSGATTITPFTNWKLRVLAN